MAGIVSGTDGEDLPETAEKKPRAREQHNRERDFGNDEDARKAGVAASNARAAAAFAKIFNLAGIRRLQRRRQAEEKSREQRNRNAKKSALALMSTSLSRGISGGARLRMAFLRNRTVTSATTPEISERSVLSVISWRARRVRLAPSARRMAISRRRPEARASKRLAILTPAISRTNPTAPKRIKSSVRCGPTRSSFTGTSRSDQPAAAG